MRDYRSRLMLLPMRTLLGIGFWVLACSSSAGNGEVAPRDQTNEAGAGGETGDGLASAGSGALPAEGAASGASSGALAGMAGSEDMASSAGAAGDGSLSGSAGSSTSGGVSGSGGKPGGGSGTSTSGAGGGTAPVCTPSTWYADVDRDGFGNAKQSIKSCAAPSGYVADKTDCYDSNAKVHPGQLDWFPNERGDGSFDYDCSGAAELRYPIFSPCPELDNSCPPPNRWPAGFTCDYEGMIAPYSQAEDGWRLYKYSVCPPEPCTVAEVQLPGCGETGRYGKPPLAWNVTKSEYTCEPMPILYEYELGRLPKRTQTCR